LTATALPTAGRGVELTLRGLILGALITVLFTAANVYLGLKVGLTFASSIPAAVISMAVLRLFRNATIYENNIVQTVASAAGTLSSVIFVLPGLVMIGWWTGFPFWLTAGICAIGGVLGVMYTIPLRRALVTNSDLPYPEGVAAAEVLKVGAGSRADAAEAAADGKAGLAAIVMGSLASAGVALLTAFKAFAGEVTAFFRIGGAATGIGGSVSMALIGAGHLMGIACGVAMLAGLIIAWGVATPLLTLMHPAAGPAAEAATAVWKTQVRFIGAGAIGAASLWTLGKLALPVWNGLISALAADRQRRGGQGATLPITERDIPIGLVGVIIVACLVPLAALLYAFLAGGALQGLAVPLIAGAVLYTVIVGFLVAGVCGYMAGLIGSSNSPVSGLCILAVLGAAGLLAVTVKTAAGPENVPALVAFALFVTAVVLCVATIANDNLQDLKTGQLVNATPWKQQLGLIVGVAVGALIIPPILDLLNRTAGFAGAASVHIAGATPLPAPQATLISTLAKGALGGHLPLGLLGIGALVGIGLVVVDEILRKTGRYSLPPLAVGLAIYLPSAVTAPVVVGAVAGWLYDRWVAKGPRAQHAKHMGVLLASGLIVGEGLFNVALALLVATTNNGSPLGFVGAPLVKLFGGEESPGFVLFSFVGYFAIAAWLYVWVRRRSLKTA